MVVGGDNQAVGLSGLEQLRREGRVSMEVMLGDDFLAELLHKTGSPREEIKVMVNVLLIACAPSPWSFFFLLPLHFSLR